MFGHTASKSEGPTHQLTEGFSLGKAITSTISFTTYNVKSIDQRLLFIVDPVHYKIEEKPSCVLFCEIKVKYTFNTSIYRNGT